MSIINDRISKIHNDIIAACQEFRRNPQEIKILAVSKYHPSELVVNARHAGQLAFGENYVQEAIPKIVSTKAYNLEWHFIGHIQSNKTRAIAEHFDWVHTVASAKVANRLNQQAAYREPINVCIEVNVDLEENKSGVLEAQLLPLAEHIQSLKNLRLRGLMAIPKLRSSFNQQRQPYAKCRELLSRLQLHFGKKIDTLSMGMSNDFQAAIAEGATIIRIGTAIFGPRE